MDIEDVRGKYEVKLMDLPNVKGVWIGKKNEKDVIFVGVTHKVLDSSLRPEEKIPKTLEGYEVEVEDIGDLTAYTK
ncbi:hypothetical protein MSSAC_3002 [Methanosarcina siciliae C2J]|uniref:Uncharacterized protein n=1 Tax=Methanosarcina siciliae C2J TaxID=1434118 RepID=A0A0E3PRA0_9EURY|nr:hypothetical protein [Methanosarcina siciliae]AKB37592.1 hypothetical protein MSSAC_3002 [Methanosarcina siciliae C2J]